MQDNWRFLFFGVVLIVAAALAAWKVISGDAWLTLALGLLLPSPLDGRRPGGPAGPAVGVTGILLVDFFSTLARRLS